MTSSAKLSKETFAARAARRADWAPEKSYQIPTPRMRAAPAAQPTRPPVTRAGAERARDDFLCEGRDWGTVADRMRFGLVLDSLVAGTAAAGFRAGVDDGTWFGAVTAGVVLVLVRAFNAGGVLEFASGLLMEVDVTVSLDAGDAVAAAVGTCPLDWLFAAAFLRAGFNLVFFGTAAAAAAGVSGAVDAILPITVRTFPRARHIRMIVSDHMYSRSVNVFLSFVPFKAT